MLKGVKTESTFFPFALISKVGGWICSLDGYIEKLASWSQSFSIWVIFVYFRLFSTVFRGGC